MDNFTVLRDMKPEELQELLNIYRAKNEGLTLGGQMHKPVMVNTMEESLLASLPNTSGQIDPMTGLRSFQDDDDDFDMDAEVDSYEEEDLDTYDQFETNTQDALEYMRQQNENRNRNNNNQPPPPPPPKYYDKLGREYNTQAEADIANGRIDTQRAQLANEFTDLKTDDTWDLKKVEGLPTYADLPESEVKTQFDNQMLVAQKEGATQLQGFGEAMYKLLTAVDEKTGAFTNLNLTWDDYIAANGEPAGFGRLSETSKRSLWELQKGKAQRKEAFELTPAEIAMFERDAIEVEGTVADATASTVTAPGAIAGETITSEDVDQTTVKDFGFVEGTDEVLYDTEFVDKVRGKSDQAFEILIDTIMGRRPSQAQQMMTRESEKLQRSFLSAIAGTEAEPEKRRQLQNLWSEQGNALLRDRAELRSQEEAAARQQMIQLIEIDGGREARLALADLETRRQTAFQNADLDQVRKITDAQNKLTAVIAEADTEMKAKMANLSAQLEVAKKNGDLEVAVAIAVMQKNLAIATINAELALKSRALDDGNAIENYRGKQALYGSKQRSIWLRWNLISR
jgi:hypothetical protein